ncbi:MFS transporter [Nocardia sp. NPDC047038]|uniref:MFS transporter n=1 Tax=Nocardia TaxID=1817 RepID=UPI0033F08C6A
MVSSTTAARDESDVGSRRLLIVGSICAALVGLDALIVAPLAPTITRDTHASVDSAGLLVTTYALVYAVTGPLFGPVSDRWGRRNVILTGLTIFSIGTALTGIGSNFAVLLVFRGLAGLGAAMMVPSIFAAVADVVAPERRGRAIGIIMGALTGSSLIGVPVGSFAADAFSWRVSFWAIAVLAALALAVVPLTLPRIPVAATQAAVHPLRAYVDKFRAAFSNPSVLFVLLSTFFWTAGNQGMWANVGVYFTTNFDLSTTAIGLVLLVISAVGVCGNFLGGRLTDRFGKRVVIAAAGLGVAVALIAFSSLDGALVVPVIVAALWVLAFNIGASSITTLVSELAPAARGTALGLNSSALYAGSTVGTSASVAVLSGTHSFVWLGITCAVSCLLVFPIVLGLVHEQAAEAVA